MVAAALVLPRLIPAFFRRYGGRPSELEAKLLMFCLFALGALASWADSEAVLPAYLLGMVLAGTVGKDHALIRRLRTLTFGFLTPFYFIRAGSLVSLPALARRTRGLSRDARSARWSPRCSASIPWRAPTAHRHQEGMYTTLLMSTGLTFGTISALFGLSHELIDQAQYSALVAAVIGSAVVPTLIANAFFLPRHLLPERREDHEANSHRLRWLAILRPKASFPRDSTCAHKYDAELHVLAVASPPEFGQEVETKAVIEQSRRHCHDIQQPLQAAVGPTRNAFESKVVTSSRASKSCAMRRTRPLN